MDLHIKSQEAITLAEEAARLTGESVDEAVTAALRERVERLKREQEREQEEERLIADIKAITGKFAAEFKEPFPNHGEFLYDERGLPK